MRDFIKKGIQAKLNIESAANTPEAVDNETILEYASLFQELDDLSVDGTEAGNVRKLGMDIPLDDDVELETIEFNVADGKVGDVRGDNTATTVAESYEEMKTLDQFYQEALEEIPRLPRESDDGYKRRVSEYAEQMYNEYCADAEACGYFGFDKIKINDSRVTSRMNVNFGPMYEGSSDNFVTKVNTFFATDEKHNLTQKQLDSVSLVKEGALKNIGSSLKAYMESNYDVDSNTSVWDVVTPKTLIVPKGNADSFCVVLEYTNEITGKSEYFGWTAPVYGKDENREDIINSCEKINMESFYNETHYENRDKFLQEQAYINAEIGERIANRERPNRFFQEAIEGLEDAPTEGGDAAPADDTAATDAPPAEGGDANADAAGTDAAPAEGEEQKKKETAAVNDVSSEIAEKVANDTQNDAESDAEQVTFADDEVNPDDNVNVADEGNADETAVEDENASTDSVDADMDAAGDADEQLAELDELSSGSEDDLGGDAEATDSDLENIDTGNIDDMSVNQLLELGTESLKNMKVGELKDLISKGDNEAIAEAFILTPKNVNKEVDVKIRECLGVLNDNKMDVEKILGKFKHKGHKLNRTLSKAAKMTKVYSSDEIASIKKLNSCLAELLLTLRKGKAENYGSAIKGKIKDFTKEAEVVAAIVEDKMGKGADDTVLQEGLFLSSSNAKKRLGRKITPVYADMMSIAKMASNQVLNKGKINKMYKPIKRSSMNTWSAEPGRDGGFGYKSTSQSVTEINTPQSENINDLQRILSKIVRKPKVQRAFTSEEMGMISDVIDRLDDFVDLVESLIYDTSNNDNTALLDKIGEYATNIAELLQKLNDVCNSVPVADTNAADTTTDTAEADTTETTDTSETTTETETTEGEDTSSTEEPEEEEKKEEEEPEVEALEDDDVVVEEDPYDDDDDDKDEEEDED